jgi:uncharacterized Zn-binding protein involved in type VI secretion
MPTVAVNPPKTPVTKGSNGMATATLPNICKMPGPPAPFVPTPLPNIGMSSKDPQGYSTKVTIEGQPVAIQGATFGSTGDIASKGTGGGLISSNAEGPTKFLAPGSLDVKIEGKNVQLLGDQMFNNCGPSGSPPNAATMAGVLQPPLIAQAAGLGVLAEVQKICDTLCECQASGEGQNCISRNLKADDKAMGGMSPIKAEAPYNMSTDPPSPMPYPGNRRPDAVIVSNPLAPATQDNLRAVVEIKIGPDDWHDGQQADYEKIAGDPAKVIEVNSENCQCPDEPDPKPIPVPVPVAKKKPKQLEFPGWAKGVALGVAAVAGVAAAILAAPEVAAGAAAAAVFGLFAGTGSGSGSATSPGGGDPGA